MRETSRDEELDRRRTGDISKKSVRISGDLESRDTVITTRRGT